MQYFSCALAPEARVNAVCKRLITMRWSVDGIRPNAFETVKTSY